MQELVILSGKGGTGKTSLVGSLAVLAEKKVLVDCDVDAANLYLITKPQIVRKESFSGGIKARIDQQKCNSCGVCLDYCRFEAITVSDDGVNGSNPVFDIDQLACEGCDLCSHFCPEDAIITAPVETGEWYISDTPYGPMVHGRLGIAEGNSGKLVSLLRDQARDLAAERELNLAIIDGPPGIGCPAIATLTGASYVLIVTEPSLSAYHDLKRVADLARHFRLPVGICLNKSDINARIAGEIETYARNNNMDFLGALPYDALFTRAQVAGKTLIEYTSNQTTDRIRSLWVRLQEKLELGNKDSLPADQKKR